MPRPRDDERAGAMYELYQRGKSLAQVGEAFGITRQTVYNHFRLRGWPVRPKTFQAKVEFNGESYTPDPDGYYRKTTGDRGWLHHAVWKAEHGIIQRGKHIHHIDGDQANNAIENLACVTPGDHSRLHHPYQRFERATCLWCGEPLRRKRQPSGRLETPAEVKRRLYCGQGCADEHKRGKPKGWSPRQEAGSG